MILFLGLNLLLFCAQGQQTTNASSSGIQANYTIASKYLTDMGMLFYDKLDQFGNIVERIEKYFPLPPISECSSTNVGAFVATL